MARAAVACATLAAASAACGSGDRGAGEDGVSVRDSAGIEIVTSTAPRLTGEEAWRVGESPVLSIGLLDGPPELQLFRAVDAARLSDGRIVVANAGSHELRFYDAGGAHLASVGGEGEGPGEFTALASLDASAEDTLFAWDRQLRRVSVFTPAGDFVRSFQLAAGERQFPQYVGRFGDGRLLVAIPSLVSEPPADFDIVGSDLVYAWYTPEGAAGDTIGAFPTGRSMIRTQGVGGFAFFQIPFQPQGRLAAGPTSLYEGAGEAFEIRVREADGRISRMLRRSFEPMPATTEMVEAVFEAEWAEFPDPDFRRTAREAYDAMPMASHLPAFDRLLLERTGRLWVRHHVLPGAETVVWSIFDPSGAWMSDVTAIASLQPVEAGDGYLLGITEDELGVESVVLYEVERGLASAAGRGPPPTVESGPAPTVERGQAVGVAGR